MWKRVSGVQYFLEHHHGIFYVLTNAPMSEIMEWSGEGYYLARCCLEDLLSCNWQVNFVLTPELIYGYMVLSLCNVISS